MSISPIRSGNTSPTQALPSTPPPGNRPLRFDDLIGHANLPSQAVKRRRMNFPIPLVLDPHFVSRAKQYNDSNGLEFLRQDARALKIGDFLGKGHFVNAYSATFREGMQVLKFPHFENAKREDNPKKPMWTLAYEIKQYVQLTDLRFNINRHFNFDTFLDRGDNLARYREIGKIDRTIVDELCREFPDAFYRVEYVERPFLSREELDEFNQEITRLAPEAVVETMQKWERTNHPLYQLKKMFAFAWDHQKIPLDLQLPNVRIRADGTIVLCDLYYESEKFSRLVVKTLETFATRGSALWNYLIPLGGQEFLKTCAP